MVEIDIGSNISVFRDFILSWHGFYSFIAVAVAVVLVGRWSPMKGIDPDEIYSTAIWAIIGGVIGARVVHVADNWGYYSANPSLIVAIWTGGIGLWGGILGGFLGGIAYAAFKHFPLVKMGQIADLAAPAMLLSQSIGRIGDVINGEHCARALDFPLAWIWTNPASDAGACPNGVGIAVHPVIGYEILWNFLSLFIVWKLRNRLKPDGMIFALYIALYSVGRFFITFGRTDNLHAFGLQEAQFIALIVLAIAIPVLIIKARPVSRDALAQAYASEIAAVEAPRPERGTRAQRRRNRR